jgi:hypothetical protein
VVKLRIQHRTIYRYSQPVVFRPHRVMGLLKIGTVDLADLSAALPGSPVRVT